MSDKVDQLLVQISKAPLISGQLTLAKKFYSLFSFTLLLVQLCINYFCHVICVCHVLTQQTYGGLSSLEVNKQHMIKITLTQQSLLLWNCQLMLFPSFIFSGGFVYICVIQFQCMAGYSRALIHSRTQIILSRRKNESWFQQHCTVILRSQCLVPNPYLEMP